MGNRTNVKPKERYNRITYIFFWFITIACIVTYFVFYIDLPKNNYAANLIQTRWDSNIFTSSFILDHLHTRWLALASNAENAWDVARIIYFAFQQEVEVMMLSFVSVPDIVSSVSMILCYISLVIVGFTAIAHLISLFGNDYQTKVTKYSAVFSSGIHIRNSMFCTLLLMFFISNANSLTIARKTMKMVASVCYIYSIGSAVVLAIAIISLVLTAIRSISESSVHEANKKLWRSSLFSFSICLIISTFINP